MSLAQTVRYLTIGVASVGLYIATLNVMSNVWSIGVATIVAYAIATAFNYVGNYHWSFASQTKHGVAILRYITLVSAGLVLNAFLVTTMVEAGVSVTLAGLIFSAAWPIVSFAGMKFWALR